MMPKLFRVKYEGSLYLLSNSIEDAEDAAFSAISEEVMDNGEATVRVKAVPVEPGHKPGQQWGGSLPRLDDSCEIDDGDIELSVQEWIKKMEASG
jgi:hypothetical protein